MNEYPLDELYQRLHQAGVRRVWTEATDHGGPRGLMMYFRKGSD